MALTSVNYVRPKLAGTLAEAYQATFKAYEDATNAQVIVDEYATINSAVRLIERTVFSSSYVGSQKTSTIKTYSYASAAASTYDPTNLASATTTPFTIALGTLKNTFVNVPTDLDAIYTTAGDARG